jgi:hypothetical protein
MRPKHETAPLCVPPNPSVGAQNDRSGCVDRAAVHDCDSLRLERAVCRRVECRLETSAQRMRTVLMYLYALMTQAAPIVIGYVAGRHR